MSDDATPRMNDAFATDTPVHDWRRDVLNLTLLLALVFPLRVWLLNNTEVTARDSIGYIRYALQIENLGWDEALRKNHQHPGYPLAVLAASMPVRAWSGTEITTANMQFSAQLASTIAGLLLMLPMYFAGKMLFDRGIAFWGTLFFQVMPISGHHLSDGISEAVFLLFTCSSLCFGLMAFRGRSPWAFALTGTFAGLAYLTRPEGAVVLMAACMVLALHQFLPACRQSWKRTALLGTSLVLPAVLVGSLYFGFTGKFTNKPSAGQIFGTTTASLDLPGSDTAQQAKPDFAQSGDSGRGARPVLPLMAVCFAGHYDAEGPIHSRLLAGLHILLDEITQIFHYWGLLGLVLGIAWHGRRLFRRPEFALIMTYSLLHLFLVLALAVKAGYLSDRHLMVLTIWGSFFAAAGFRDLPAYIQRWREKHAGRPVSPWLPPAYASLGVLALFVVSCLPQTLERIHVNRRGNRAAGVWLAERLQSGDMIVDDHAWSHYYAGLVFHEHEIPVLEPDAQPRTYVVMTRSRDEVVSKERRARERELQSKNGHIVYHWPEKAAEDEARIVVYSLPRDFNTNPWTKKKRTD